MYLKVNPRKFSDKIALIKRKEALSNASFHSAIHGINEITVDGQPDADLNAGDFKDNYSNNSYSPDSFTSESTAVSLKHNYPPVNDSKDLKSDNVTSIRENEMFNSCQELSQTNAMYQSDQVADRAQMKVPDSNLNMDKFYHQNKNLKRLCEPMSSGSLPNVSVWNNTNEFVPKNSGDFVNSRDTSQRESSFMQGLVTNVVNGKFGTNNKQSILTEYLMNQGPQNQTNPHPNKMQVINDPSLAQSTGINSASTFYRTRRHGLDHGDLNPPVHAMDQYLSLPHRPTSTNVNPDYRHSYSGEATNPSMKYMKLNISGGNDSDFPNYGFPNKALTPTGCQSNNWADNSGYGSFNNGFLQPQMFSNVLANENWRRVASDSSLQNSLKYHNDNLAQHNTGNTSFERVNSLKREHVNNTYQQHQSLTSRNPKRNTQHNYNESSQFPDFPRETPKVPLSPLLTDNVLDIHQDISLKSDKFKRPENNQRQMFMYPKETCNGNQPPPPFKNESYIPMEIGDAYRDQFTNDMDLSNPNICDHNFQNSSNDNNNNCTDTHECYWGRSNDMDMVYTKEPSPQTKPCENLDPQNVLVDIKADFSGIPEIILPDTEQQRRDSLNWTVEVLKNLNSESGGCESFSTRDRSLSGYQPMITLREEEKCAAEVIDL